MYQKFKLDSCFTLAISAPFDDGKSIIKTDPPCLIKFLAVANPNPDDPPVTNAILEASMVFLGHVTESVVLLSIT